MGSTGSDLDFGRFDPGCERMPVDSGSCPGAHSPKVRCETDQIPFASYVGEAPQTELSEADNAFDPSEHWFDNHFSTTVSGLPLATERDDHVYLYRFGSFEIRFGSVSSIGQNLLRKLACGFFRRLDHRDE